VTGACQRFLISLLPIVLGCGDKDDTAADDTAAAVGSAGTACLSLAEEPDICPAGSTIDPSELVPVSCGATVLSVEGEGSVGSDPTGRVRRDSHSRGVMRQHRLL
jgi:hypothetical protein